MKLWIVSYDGGPKYVNRPTKYDLEYGETVWLIRAETAQAAIELALGVCGEDHKKRPEYRDIWRAVSVDELAGPVSASFTGID